MMQTTEIEFQRRVSEFQQEAQREPVEITRRGRRELVLMSADHYDWLMAATRRAYRTEETPAIVLEAVRNAEMDPRFADLDDRMT